MSGRVVVATQYYDVDLLNQLCLLNDIRWLFTMGGIDQFIETQDGACTDLTLEFLNTLYVEVTCGPRCKQGYISFYLKGEFYEFILTSYTGVFGFPPCLDLPWRHVPHLNTFWFETLRDYQYNTSTYKGTFIRNPCI